MLGDFDFGDEWVLFRPTRPYYSMRIQSIGRMIENAEKLRRLESRVNVKVGASLHIVRPPVHMRNAPGERPTFILYFQLSHHIPARVLRAVKLPGIKFIGDLSYILLPLESILSLERPYHPCHRFHIQSWRILMMGRKPVLVLN